MRTRNSGGPRPRDADTLDSILGAFYDVISGPAGRRRDWERDRALYLPGAKQVATGVRNGKPFALAMDHDAYASRADELFRHEGFFEREIHRSSAIRQHRPSSARTNRGATRTDRSSLGRQPIDLY
jgi:hypothetical protein